MLFRYITIMGVPKYRNDKGIITKVDKNTHAIMRPSPVDIETVGQYTGLTDKNGRKIFEGDILGAHLDVNYPEDETIAVIVWANNAWCIQELGAEPDIIGDDELKNDGWEIIGNIYDNPELLEVDNG